MHKPSWNSLCIFCQVILLKNLDIILPKQRFCEGIAKSGYGFFQCTEKSMLAKCELKILQ